MLMAGRPGAKNIPILIERERERLTLLSVDFSDGRLSLIERKSKLSYNNHDRFLSIKDQEDDRCFVEVPDHALIVDQVEDVLGDLELAVLREVLLQVPAPAAVEGAHEQRPNEVDDQNLRDGEHLRAAREARSEKKKKIDDQRLS